MMVKALLIYMLLCAPSVFGQTYAYSYQGILSSEDQVILMDACSKLPHVISCKIRQKDEKGQGEMIVQVEKTDRPDMDNPFSIVDLKSLLIENGLTPISCTELKTTR